MTSRERIRRLLAREPTDRIPNGLGGCETAGLHNVAYDRLKRLVGAGGDANRVCTFMNNAVFDPEVLDAIDGDVILLGSRFADRVVFYGGAYDAVQLLIETPPDDVYQNVREHIAALSAGGGYLFAGVHNLPADLPSSHIDALLAAYRDCRYDPTLVNPALPEEGVMCAHESRRS